MQLTYELTQKDFFDAFIAHRNRRAVTRWSFRIFITIVFGMAALGMFMLVFRQDSQTLSSFAPLFVLAAFWGLHLWGSPWLAAKNQFRKQPSAQGQRTLLVDDLGVHWRWNGGTADIEWKNLIRWHETKGHFLLYSSPVCFNIVPKRSLTEEHSSELRSYLASHLPATKQN